MISALSLPILVAIVGGVENYDNLIDGHINNGIYVVLLVIFSFLGVCGLLSSISRFSDNVAIFVNTFNGTVVGALMTMNMAKYSDGTMSGFFAFSFSLGLFISLEFIDNIKEIKNCFYEPEKEHLRKIDNFLNGLAIVITVVTLIVFFAIYYFKIKPMIDVL